MLSVMVTYSHIIQHIMYVHTLKHVQCHAYAIHTLVNPPSPTRPSFEPAYII